jgi:hypothetical protein
MKRTKKTTAAGNSTNTQQGTGTTQQTTEEAKKKTWGDTNGDGRFDLDDILIGIKEMFQWVFSWRGAMALFGLGLIGSAALNIASWVTVMRPLASLAPMAGFVVWGTIQAFEIMPTMDDLNLSASLSAMVRRQRKPLEVPVLNDTLNPDAKRLQRRYKRREANQEIMGEFMRYALYGLEFCILILGGNLVNYLGVSWGNVLLAVLGMVGVEVCLRMVNYCGDRLMTRDERDFMDKLKATAKNVSVSLD